jgi:hypothetical protein
MVATVTRELELERPLVSAVGGITHSGMSFEKRFNEALHAQLPYARIVHARLSPVIGSVILAMQRQGLRLSATELATLQEAVVKATSTPPGAQAAKP